MTDLPDFAQNAQSNGILVDTNLLVLFVVGAVNRRRIPQFKRTSRYTPADYDLLTRVVGRFSLNYTLPHLLTEVSNLTDLPGSERAAARALFRDIVSVLKEVPLASRDACDTQCYPHVGLADAAIALAVQHHQCSVLTDDSDLCRVLAARGASVLNFDYLRQSLWNS